MIFLLLCPDEENGVFAKPLVVQKLALLSIGIKLTMIFGKRWGAMARSILCQWNAAAKLVEYSQ
jgi:hypothetical protein